MSASTSDAYVSRGGDKLAAALGYFQIDVTGYHCADLGSHVGGFVDCLLQRGAARVYSVDTSYGTLAWKLRKDARVVVLERTNAMHLSLPGPVDLVTIDAGWTRQCKLLPSAARLLGVTSSQCDSDECNAQQSGSSATLAGKPGGTVISLVKPHYEAKQELLDDGVLPDNHREETVSLVLDSIEAMGWSIGGTFESPIPGHGGNREVFALLSWSGD